MDNKKPAVMNAIWLFMVLISIVVAAYTGKMDALTKISFDAAKSAVMIAIGLIGAMALWLGIMKVAEAAGLMKMIARAMRPIMVRLFPDIPADHPAMSAMIMNFAANLMGLGNAATPMGIKAMGELEKINPRKGTASNSMCLFLAINTSHLAIIPTGVIAIRAAAGVKNPADILVPSLLATACAMTTAIILAKLFARRNPDPKPDPEQLKHDNAVEYATDGGGTVSAPKAAVSDAPAASEFLGKIGKTGKIAALILIILFVAAIPYHYIHAGTVPHLNYQLFIKATGWLVPFLIGLFMLFGYFRNVKIYETVVEGAKDGFKVATAIIPPLVAIFVAVGMLRESGALDFFAWIVNPLLKPIGMPPEALPMALLRPLSGSGAFGYMSEVVNHAPDSFVSFLVSIIQGSTETTFYVLAVYFGSVGIRHTRYAVTVGLMADAVGVFAALLMAHLFFAA